MKLIALWLIVTLTAVASVISLIQSQDEQARTAAAQQQILYVQHHQNDALHSIMCRAEKFIRNSTATPAQKQKALRFYDEALKHAHLASCQLNEEGSK